MRLPRAVLPGLLLLLLTAAAPPASAAGRLCDERAGRTIAATPVGRVFRDTSRPGDPVIRGCRHGTRTSVRMAIDGDCRAAGRVDRVVAAGRFAALARSSCTGTGMQSTVLLFDLRTGRNLLGSVAFTGPEAAGATAMAVVTELSLSPAGALAWVATIAGGAPAGSELHLRRPGVAAPELADHSDLPDITDIAVTAHTLFWLAAGDPRSITL